jgi:hypothetical protein
LTCVDTAWPGSIVDKKENRTASLRIFASK